MVNGTVPVAQRYEGRERIFELFRETRRLTDGTYLQRAALGARRRRARVRRLPRVRAATRPRRSTSTRCCSSTTSTASGQRITAIPSDPPAFEAFWARHVKIGLQLPEVERVVRRDELAGIARAAEELGFDSLWVGDHLLYRGDGRARARAVGLLHDAGVARRHHRARRARAARRVHRVPPAGHPRAHVRGDRRAERRPLRRSARRRLEHDGVRGVRHPVRQPRLALRRGVRDRAAPARRRARHVRRALPHACATRCCFRRRRAGRS